MSKPYMFLWKKKKITIRLKLKLTVEILMRFDWERERGYSNTGTESAWHHCEPFHLCGDKNGLHLLKLRFTFKKRVWWVDIVTVSFLKGFTVKMNTTVAKQYMKGRHKRDRNNIHIYSTFCFSLSHSYIIVFQLIILHLLWHIAHHTTESNTI